MRAVDSVFAEKLRDVLEAKINKCRREILHSYMPTEVQRIEAQIMAYQWVQARIQDLVIENGDIDKDTKIPI